jgi:hypothetical protein
MDDATRTEIERATKIELDAHLAQAEAHADLGLPVGTSERFRLAKRVVARVSWPFLRHQIAFNHAVIQSNRKLAERMNRLLERIDDLRSDLLDFADRSVSQAHAEIGSDMAEARRVHADLILELRSVQAELNRMLATLSSALPTEGDGVDVESDAHEGRR